MGKADMALLCKALSDYNRLQIVELLADGEKCACRLLEDFDITQPTLSHHMRILCECGMVEARKEGRWQHYSLRADVLAELSAHLGQLAVRARGIAPAQGAAPQEAAPQSVEGGGL